MRRTMACCAIACAAFCAAALAQPDIPNIEPIRTVPAERITVNPGFRDWGPTTVAGTTILGGNSTNRGGVFAVDMPTGRVRWTYRPVLNGGTASVPTAPGVSGNVVIVPFAAASPGAVVGMSLATGKEMWRGPDPARGAAVAIGFGLAYVLGKDGNFYALDAATGREAWRVAFATNRAVCASRPIVRDDTIYLTGSAGAGYYLFALDARSGQERWRYRAEAPDVAAGVCLRQPVVTADAVFAAGDNYLYAVTRATGREQWKPIEIRRPVDGSVRGVEMDGLVDAGPVLIGMTSGFLIAVDKASGRTAWEMAGTYSLASPSTAVAGHVLYFQGSPSTRPAAAPSGTLYAIDVDTRAILWSFSRPTAEPQWPFGAVTPVDGALWVGSYQALVKLQ